MKNIGNEGIKYIIPFFMGLVIYTLVKAVLWTWNKTNNKVNAKD
jgi:hypothetical protein